ncbi:MAG: hypothetical protein JNM24_02550 [Bdellovibrionaceae bacterium]|nr:hypothetical protein [Pseudobdellovibrionaceae bacterium]
MKSLKSIPSLLLLFFAVFNTGCFLDSKIFELNTETGFSKDGGELPTEFKFPLSLNVVEGDSQDITFKIENSSDADTVFTYEFIADTALAGVNFVYAKGTFTLNKSVQEKTIPLTTFYTVLPEGNSKKFHVVWKKQENAGKETIIGTSYINLVAKTDLGILKLTSFTKTAPEVLYDADEYIIYSISSVETGTELWRSDGPLRNIQGLGHLK